MPRSPYHHASSIFAKGRIPATVQVNLNQPMFAFRWEHLHGRGFLSGKTGDTELDFTAGLIAFALPDPDKLALETIDLSNPGLVEVIIQHGTGLDDAFFEPSMTIMGLLGALEIGLYLSKARFWLVRSKQALNIFIQTGLVLFDRQEVIPTPGYDWLRNCPLGMQGISGHNFASQ